MRREQEIHEEDAFWLDIDMGSYTADIQGYPGEIGVFGIPGVKRDLLMDLSPNRALHAIALLPTTRLRGSSPQTLGYPQQRCPHNYCYHLHSRQ